MGRTIAAALTGIALLIGGSVALILWLTGPSSAASPAKAALPLEPPAPATTPGAAFALSPSEADPEPAPEPVVPPPPPVAFPPELDLRDDVPALEAQVTKRCGRMRLAVLQEQDQAPDPQGRAVLLLSMQTLAGQARIVDSTVHSPGRTRPALVACAQWALRGQVLSAPGVEAGRSIKVPVVLGL